MSDIAIRCKGLSKSYRLGQRESYKALRDVLSEAAAAPFRRLRNSLSNGNSSSSNGSAATSNGQSVDTNIFWALEDVSFEIKRGDVVGVIGRNGAGKSTLLKVLSRITKPTKGEAQIHGRVGSLLEVGTGFHPELTGHENIYLNGAILGMRKLEIDRKFDEIVAFAEIEKFIDTPVKRYSSGMYIRLAFAVAAQLEPEILVIDEVLAVGDAAFQKKCLGKLGDVSRQGRTILFVSHNMAAVSNLCSSAILLEGGRVVSSGETAAVINQYLESGVNPDSNSEDVQKFRPSWATPLITSARLLNNLGQEQCNFPLQSDVTIELTFKSPEPLALTLPVMGIVINHRTMGTVGGVNTRMTGFNCGRGPFYSGTIECRLLQLPLLQGSYTVDLWLGDGPQDLDCLVGYLQFTIQESDIYGTGSVPFGHQGTVFLRPQWQLHGSNETSQAV